MKKGVSAIIATILLLMITIALAGTTYIYMTSMVTGKTSKTVSVLDASCTNNIITIVLSDDGTANLTNTASSTDVKFFVNNVQITTGSPIFNMAPHTSVVVSVSDGSSGTKTLLIVSPSNAIRQTVYC